MLTYKESKTHFEITETQMGFTNTKITKVQWTKDLMFKRSVVPNRHSEPFLPTTQASRDWFEKHYRKHFTG